MLIVLITKYINLKVAIHKFIYNKLFLRAFNFDITYKGLSAEEKNLALSWNIDIFQNYSINFYFKNNLVMNAYNLILLT